MVPGTDFSAQKQSCDNPFPRYILAGLLAVFIHMSFLFFAREPETDLGKIENVKYVTLLPLDTKLPSEQVLLQWMDIMDPTGVVKPDRRNGFSVAPPKIAPEDQKMNLKKHFSQVNQGAFLPLHPPVQSQREKVRRFWSFSSAGVPSAGYNISRTKVNYPLWLREDGTMLPQLFKDVLKVKEILKKHNQPVNETILKWESNGPGLFPRVRLDVSCGNSKLDHLALKTLSLKGGKLFPEKTSSTEPSFIAVKWGE